MKLFLLGNGNITINDEEVKLSFKKAYALLFYLLIENIVPRENMVNLLWGDLSEDSAKRNLRNAVYVIRKNINNELITSPKRDLLKINKDIIDYVDIFNIDSMSADELLMMTDIVFLNGFHVTETPYFDEWLQNQRYHYSELLVRRMSLLASECLDKEDGNTAEKLCKKMILFDEYDENAYRLLFSAFELQGKHSAIAQTYNQLCDILNHDLMLKPDDATKLAFESAMMDKSRESNKTISIYGRTEELNALKASLFRHEKYKKNETVLMCGPYGIGKSTVMNAFFDVIQKDNLVLEGRCYKAEMDFPLSPWFVLLEELRDHMMNLPDQDHPQNLGYIDRLISGEHFDLEHMDERNSINSYFIEKVVYDWIDILKKYRTVVILFEDIQWMDKISLKILTKLMSLDIYIVMSLNTDYALLETYYDRFKTKTNITTLELKPFSKIETFEYAERLIEKENIELSILEKIYSKSNGNPLFITEILSVYDKMENELPKKIVEAMQTRLRLLSREEQKVLNIASNFYDYFNYEDINSISGMDEWVLIDTLSELVKKHILLEVKRFNDPYFIFSHQLFRECVYSQVPHSIRRVYHLKIGLQLEKRYKNPTLTTIYRLLYNYSLANEPIKELKYRIQFVTDYFNIVHEMFPIVGSQMNYYSDYSEIVDLNELHVELERIESLHNKVKDQLELGEHNQLLFDYYKIIGRYHNIKGHYTEASDYIKKMYEIAEKTKNTQDLLSSNLQMIYYAINIRDIKTLDQHLKEAFKIVESEDLSGMRYVLLRLKGYCSILKGEFDEGIKIMKDVIQQLQTVDKKDRFILNIIGAYYYMGEGYRFKGDLNSSMQYYDKAMNLCIKHGYSEKLAFLYGAKGQLYYELGDYNYAKKNLEKAKDIYTKMDAAWGRAINLGYYAMCLLREGNYKESLVTLKNIESSFLLMNDSYQKALILRIKAEICFYLKNNTIEHELTDYITCDKHKYCVVAIDQLKNINSTYEVELLEKMESLCGLCKTKHIS